MRPIVAGALKRSPVVEGEAEMVGPCTWGIDLGTSAAHPALLAVALDRLGRPSRVVVADRWREAEFRDALHKAGIPSAGFETRGMG